MTAPQHTATEPNAAILHEGTLDAEYTVVRSSATRDWVAVGTVRNALHPHLLPAWLLVGTGKSAPEAVADLRQCLAEEARRRTLVV